TLLIGLQMLLSVAVIAGTLLMYRQMEWLNSQPLGFDKANKVDITVHRTASGGEFRSVVERLVAHPAIRQASMSEVFPGSLVASRPGALADDGGHSRMLMLDWYNVDERYLDTLGITRKEGRNFEVYTQASSEVGLQPLLVNQALVREMGWEVALGKELYFQV